MAKGIQLADLIIQASVVQLLILAIAVLKQYAYVVKTYLEGIMHPPWYNTKGPWYNTELAWYNTFQAWYARFLAPPNTNKKLMLKYFRSVL